VLFVIAKGFRPTFVSKKILKQPPQLNPGDVVVSHAGCCYEVIKATDSRVVCYPIDLTLSVRRRTQEQFVFPAEQLTIITSSYPVSPKLPQRELVTTQRIFSLESWSPGSKSRC
jgi:hypothetical protein